MTTTAEVLGELATKNARLQARLDEAERLLTEMAQWERLLQTAAAVAFTDKARDYLPFGFREEMERWMRESKSPRAFLGGTNG